MSSSIAGSRLSFYSLDEGGPNFKERQREHFSRIIQQKWECDRPGHTVCVPTDDGQHWSLTDQHIKDWINALISGKGTTAEPPRGTFEDIGRGAVWNRKDGTMSVKVVPISPARQRDSIHSLGSSLRRKSNAGNTRIVSLISQSEIKSVSSTIGGGPGSLAGKALRWLGKKSLDVVEDAAAIKHGNDHISCFKAWQKSILLEVGPAERRKASVMLEDALEMSKPCFSKNINNLAYDIGKEAQNWLHKSTDLPHTPDNVLLLLRVQICMIPLILTRISDKDPLAGDLAWELLEALTRAPLLLIDGSPNSKQQSVNYEDTSAIAIRIIARELAYSKCAMQHPWLALYLLSIVEMTLEIRPLSDSELSAIWELALRREEQSAANMKTNSRSWEVALFAHCASQCSDFKEAILQPTGFPHLIETLENSLASTVRTENIPWENAILTLRSLAFLAEHDWIVESDVMNERALAAIMAVFRRDIPERRLPLHYWATHTLRNIAMRRPGVVRVLVNKGILTVLSRIIPAIVSPSQTHFPPPSPPGQLNLGPQRTNKQDSHDNQRKLRHRRQSSLYGSLEVVTIAQDKLLDDYRRETAKCAEALNVFVNKYMTWTPDALPGPVSTDESVWELTL